MQPSDEISALIARLHSVHEHQRARIARELQEELGQKLSLLQIDLFCLETRLPQGDKVLYNRIREISKSIDNMVASVERISAELWPELLDDFGLVAALEWQTREFQVQTGIQSQISLPSIDVVINKNLSTAIFRIFQEALNNVARHANATSVHIDLARQNGHLRLIVQDNGKGITREQIHDPESLGIIGMQERVRFMKGDLKIEGFKNEGTTVTLQAPVSS